MRIKIGSKSSLNETKGTKRDIYEVLYLMKIAANANFEQIKTDCRAIKGVAIVSSVPDSREEYEIYEKITYRIKFVPYKTPLKDFLHNLEASFRQLSKFGVMSFARTSTPKKKES
tara:strand:+ start:661 stop:1005 length:345 start_codon:yes stop_codon:yes gene_type:complete